MTSSLAHRLTGEPFEVPAGFDLGAYRTGFVAGRAPVAARVRFQPPVARRITEEWDPRHIEERHPGGGLTVRMIAAAARRPPRPCPWRWP